MLETTSTTVTTISFQQSNTTDGSYDVHAPLPKPVTVEAVEPRRAYIGHPTNPGPEFGNLVGFVSDPDSFEVKHLSALPENPESLVGMFPVYADGGFWTDTRVIESIVSFETAGSVTS